MKTENTEHISLQKITDLLASIGVMLISNGANSTRTSRNLKRIAAAYNVSIESFFSHAAVVLTVTDSESDRYVTQVKSIPHYGVNYSIVSEISILSWEIAEQKPSLAKVQEELEDIRHLNSYPEWFKFVFIGIATAALSKVFDGTNLEFVIAFFAGLLGILGRKVLQIKKYNVNICWFFGAFVSTSVVNACRLLGLQDFHSALTACVLWLIPGVPLINGFLDVFSGHVVSGWAKLAMGFLMVFMIAVGFYLSIILFGYGSF